MGGIKRLLGERAITDSSPAFAYGVKKGMGDLFVCADVTHDVTDRTKGELCYLDDETYTKSIEYLDEYEGVANGYYKRRIIFAQKFSESGLFIPAWLYSRGEKL